jgi:hypothetical protein
MNSPKTIAGPVDVSTRGNRRKAVAGIIGLLREIREAEEKYMAKVPPNLQSSAAYDAADESIDAIIEAVGYLEDAY